MLTRSEFRRDALREVSTNGSDPYNMVGYKCGININWLLNRAHHGAKWRLHLWMPPKEHVPYLDD